MTKIEKITYAEAVKEGRSAYARHAKLSEARIDQLIENFGMPTAPNGKIDPAVADEWRLTNSDLRKRKLQADIKLQDLKVSEREGSLIKKEEAITYVFETIRSVRDNLLGWIARTAPTLAHELNADPQLCFASLDRLVREFLTEESLSENSKAPDNPNIPAVTGIASSEAVE